jgi:hypothetical protein
MTMAQSLQIKLSMDKGLKSTWEYLTKEYEALDKASIMRLALNSLVKESKRKYTVDTFDLETFIEKKRLRQDGMTEDEFCRWWNDNKDTIKTILNVIPDKPRRGAIRNPSQ